MSAITVAQLVEEAGVDLRLSLIAGAAGLHRTLTNDRVQKHGLVMAGFFRHVHEGRAIVFGATELDYFAELPAQRREEIAEGFFSLPVACTVITKGLDVPEELRAAAERHGCPLLWTPLLSSSLIVGLQDHLAEALTSKTTVHGVLLDVFGVGVLLRGKSGIGKSECALDLVMRGHRLVADDVVQVLRRKPGIVHGSGLPTIRFNMEIRGLGILDIQDLFGAAAVRDRKKIEMVLELVEWDPQMEYDRLGLERETDLLLGVQVPKLVVPVRPGRNMATIVEVAARNRLLEQRGYDATRALLERLHPGGERDEVGDEIE